MRQLRKVGILRVHWIVIVDANAATGSETLKRKPADKQTTLFGSRDRIDAEIEKLLGDREFRKIQACAFQSEIVGSKRPPLLPRFIEVNLDVSRRGKSNAECARAVGARVVLHEPYETIDRSDVQDDMVARGTVAWRLGEDRCSVETLPGGASVR